MAWVAAEWVRTTYSAGKIWLYTLGTAQHRWTTLMQIADVTGVLGVSFVVAAGSGALADVWKKRGRWNLRRLWPLGAFAGLLVVVLIGVSNDRDFSGIIKDPAMLYKPYLAGKGDRTVSVVFRDHSLSDLAGFVYSKWDSKNAVNDLVDRLHRIRKSLDNKPHLVSIILDGENAWEYYPNDGRDFFLHLYERPSREQGLQCVTVSEYLAQHPAEEHIEKLHAGSWISSNFRIWIGHEEDNRAWDLLGQTRGALVSWAERNGDPEKLTKASHHIAELIYSRSAGAGGAGGPGQAGGGGSTGAGPRPEGEGKEGDVIDAEYVDVEDKK